VLSTIFEAWVASSILRTIKILQLSSAALQPELRRRGSGGWPDNAFFHSQREKRPSSTRKKSATTSSISMVHFPSLLDHGKQTNSTVSGGEPFRLVPMMRLTNSTTLILLPGIPRKTLSTATFLA
jgi:hypothetical protein